METKPYWQELNEEYDIFTSGELMDGEVEKYFKEYRTQSIHLMQKYGESAWNINDFANSLRAEKISESFFRQLVRYEMDKCFKRLNGDK